MSDDTFSAVGPSQDSHEYWDTIPVSEIALDTGEPIPQDEKYFRKIHRLEQGHPAALRYFMPKIPNGYRTTEFHAADAEVLSKVDPTKLAKKADTRWKYLYALEILANKAGNRQACEAIATLNASHWMENPPTEGGSQAFELAKCGNPDGLKQVSELCATESDYLDGLFMLVEHPDSIAKEQVLHAIQAIDTSYYVQAQPDPQTALSTLGNLASNGNTQALAFFANPPAWVFQDEATLGVFFLHCFDVGTYESVAKFLQDLDVSHLLTNLVPQELSENYLLDWDYQIKLLIVIRLAQRDNAQAQTLLRTLDFSKPADALSQELIRQLSDGAQEKGPIAVTIEVYSGILLLEQAANLGNPSAQKKLQEISAILGSTQTPPESSK